MIKITVTFVTNAPMHPPSQKHRQANVRRGVKGFGMQPEMTPVPNVLLKEQMRGML